MVKMGTIRKRVDFLKYAENLTLERVLSTICFVVGIAFLIAVLMGTWRYLFTMTISFAVGIMISDSDSGSDKKSKRHVK